MCYTEAGHKELQHKAGWKGRLHAGWLGGNVVDGGGGGGEVARGCKGRGRVSARVRRAVWEARQVLSAWAGVMPARSGRPSWAKGKGWAQSTDPAVAPTLGRLVGLVMVRSSTPGQPIAEPGSRPA